MKIRTAIVLASAAILAGLSHARASEAPDGLRWWSHVMALASDDLQGRDTGSDGHRKAAAYVAGEFERCGLRPAGTDGFLQPIGLRISWIDEEHSGLALAGPDGETPLTLGEDATISLRVDPAESVEADLVFAGYGLTIPEADHDDFRGLDVKGKVVVYLGGAPPSIAGPLAAHLQSTAERAETLRRAGAIGFISIVNPKVLDIPWSRLKLSRLMPSMRVADPAMDETRGLQIAITANPAHSDKILAGSGHTTREILDAADGGRPLPHFAIPSRIKAKVALRRAEGESQNVLGLLPGSDPILKKETVVFTAHLDHLGVGEPIAGDLIYNGAMDNAAGVAALLDVAASLKEAGAKPRRSILFAAVTGEEKGLLGSRMLANHPTVDPKGLVADINTDMFLPLYPLKRLTVFGMKESDLGDDAVEVAKSLGIAPQDDPEPKRNGFIRSDQYSFIRRGIPALALKIGYEKGSPEEQVAKKWLAERYHAPSDDLGQPVDKPAAGAFDALVAKLLMRVADRDRRPGWHDESFFKRFAE